MPQTRTRQSIRIAVAALVLLGCGTIWSVVESSGATRWVTHTLEVQLELEHVVSELKDIETGQRDYALTGDPAFLEPFNSGAASLAPALRRLMSLVSDNSAQESRARHLAALGEERLAAAQATVELAKSGRLEMASATVRGAEGKQLMDEVRRQVQAMSTEEDRLLRERLARAEAARLVTLGVTALEAALGIFLLILLTRSLHRETLRIARSEARLTATFQSIGDGVVTTDAAGNVDRMNPVAERLTGATHALAAGRPVRNVLRIVDVDSRAPIENPVEKVLRDRAVLGLVNPALLISADGSERPIEDTGAPIRDPDGSVTGAVLVFKDATEKHAARQQLAESEARFRGTFENAAVGIAHVGWDGRFLRVNDALVAITGHSRERLLTMTSAQITHPDDVDRDAEQAIALARGDLPHYSMPKRYIRPDGSFVWVNLTAALQRGRDDVPQFYISIIQDITAQKKAEGAARELTETLERRVAERTRELAEANEALQAFTYTVSHDLRAPLRGVQGFSHALVEDFGSSLPREAQGFLARIVAATTRMEGLIQDLLQYSRLGREEITVRPISLETAVAEALHAIAAEISASGAQIHIASPLPWVLGHHLTLVLTLQNILSNAVKFVAPDVQPHIEVAASIEESGVRLTVRDNGIGIKVQHQSRIFEVFERLHGSDLYTGTGIGLAIVRKAMERMGGRVGVKSTPGQGSCFWIELPPAPASTSRPDRE